MNNKALNSKRPQKTKFEADLAPVEDRTVRLLKQELQLSSNADFLSDAIALFRWAVSERKLGHQIVSESMRGERKVLVFPRLERVAPDVVLPRVEIKWTKRELASLAGLTSAPEAKAPTEVLIPRCGRRLGLLCPIRSRRLMGSIRHSLGINSPMRLVTSGHVKGRL